MHQELVERQLWEERERRQGRGDPEEVRRQRAAVIMRRAEQGQGDTGVGLEKKRKEKKEKECIVM